MNTFEEGEIKEEHLANEINDKTQWNGSFTWKCKEQLVSKLRHSKHSQAFESKIFEIGNIKWFLRLYPNGSGKNNMGFVNLFLYLCSMPINISKLRVKYSISCTETGTNWNHIKDYKPNAMGSGWSNHRLSREKLFQFNTFSFKCNLVILEKYDKNNNKIVPNMINNNNINNINNINNKPILSPKKKINMNMNMIINDDKKKDDNIDNDNDIKQIKKSIKSLNSQMKELQINVNNINNMINNMNNNKIKNDNFILEMLKDIKKDLNQIKSNQNINDHNSNQSNHNNHSIHSNHSNLNNNNNNHGYM